MAVRWLGLKQTQASLALLFLLSVSLPVPPGGKIFMVLGEMIYYLFMLIKNDISLLKSIYAIIR